MNKALLEESISSHEQFSQLTQATSFWSLLKNRDLILAVFSYGFSTFAQMSFDTIFPLLLANKKQFGGFEYDAVAESWISTFSTSLQVFSCIELSFILLF